MHKNNRSALFIILISFIFCANLAFSTTPQEDEFKKVDNSEFHESTQEFEELDEFKPATEDEFTEFNDNEFEERNDNISSQNSSGCGGCVNAEKCNPEDEIFNSKLWWVFGILLFTILTGIFVRFKSTRNLRGLTLLISLFFLGFYLGGCPCPIMSFEKLILFGAGVDTDWRHLVWFLGLIPITYFFGKVWCGWVCHLGALQEFIFKPLKFEILKGEKAQKILIIFRYIFVSALIIQLLVTETNIFCKYDPFKAAFNLLSPHTISWWLLGLLLLSSLFINRPFCRAICPIGIILGWVGKIPGATIIGLKGDCVSCKQCSDSCDIHAITRNDQNRSSTLDNRECIACGNCISSCKRSGIKLVQKSKKHDTKIILKNNEVSNSDCCSS